MNEPDQHTTQEPAGATRPAAAHWTHGSVRFEPTDISVRGVLIVILVAICLLPILQGLMLAFFRAEERHDSARKASALPLAFQQVDRPPSAPRLEQLDRMEGDATSNAVWRDAEWEARLHSYGPTDDAGFVHVPIEWAIEQAVEQLSKPQAPQKDKP